MSIYILKKAAVVTAVAASLSLASQVTAESYNPYPGKLPANLVNVVSPATVEVEAETWPGYSRNFRVSLPSIEVPNLNAPQPCQRKLAEKALSFTKKFLTDAASISISALEMSNSADQTVIGQIDTNQGSLLDALKNNGFARLADNDEPWC
ncbi:hypothetical protein Q9L42_002540 [Methylomarinum sp. Ch1-1]|uniref:Uncharacterized protein n=1 Tax=Methylomarinum roseum TaxID=3067653 RepID=A0AAU7NVJ9_9GAMM|nr:hypothetical protein [Methylomarinum sp. Ch1-1]MDP4522946.1 hypothetical protein [Methylomarinum sp. Ch1-1]